MSDLDSVFYDLINLYNFWQKNQNKFFNQSNDFDKEVIDNFKNILELFYIILFLIIKFLSNMFINTDLYCFNF